MFFSENLKKLRIKKGITQTSIAKQLNITRAAYSSWETGVYTPNHQNLRALAQFFNVDIHYFSNDDELMHKYIRLTKKNREKLLHTADQLFQSQLYTYHVHAHLSAGTGSFYDENDTYDTVYFDKKLQYDIASWVNGDSMEPTYFHQDVVLISKTGFLDNGRIYAIVYHDETFIKKIYIEKNIVRCVSLNKKYKDMLLPIEDVRIVGLVTHRFVPIEV